MLCRPLKIALELARAIRWKEGVASAQSRINDISTRLKQEIDS